MTVIASLLLWGLTLFSLFGSRLGDLSGLLSGLFGSTG
jgi:hypothetical protein